MIIRCLIYINNIGKGRTVNSHEVEIWGRPPHFKWKLYIWNREWLLRTINIILDWKPSMIVNNVIIYKEIQEIIRNISKQKSGSILKWLICFRRLVYIYSLYATAKLWFQRKIHLTDRIIIHCRNLISLNLNGNFSEGYVGNYGLVEIKVSRWHKQFHI